MGMATILVAHGAWSAGWAWRKMHRLMQAAGHHLLTPTYTGLGEREHLANRSINLETHIDDILGVIKFERLNDIVLVGHSYGGIVATGVADRAPDKIRQLIYLDAFVPQEGQSLFDLVPSAAVSRFRQGAEEQGDGWRLPPNPIPADTSPEDAAWITALRCQQPLACMEQKLSLRHGPLTLPRAYIHCTRKDAPDSFRAFYERGKGEGWPVAAIDASHSPHVTAPDLLAATLDNIIGGRR
jgi:pimeloyl-ACP methyl ester carboxylesterase